MTGLMKFILLKSIFKVFIKFLISYLNQLSWVGIVKSAQKIFSGQLKTK